MSVAAAHHGARAAEALAERWACARGDHHEVHELGEGRLADPFGCAQCNP